MKTPHLPTCPHHDSETVGTARFPTSPPPHLPYREKGGGGGAVAMLVETIWLHDGEPTHALIWGGADDGYGIHPPDRWVPKESPSTIQNMTQAGGLNAKQGLARRDRLGSRLCINRNITGPDRNMAGDAE